MNSGNQSEESASDADDVSEILKMIIDEKMIDKGSYGDVYGPFDWREQTCAVKRIAFAANTFTDDMRKNIGKKRELWTSLSHENLTKILTVHLVERPSNAVLYIFMEYLRGDTLRRTLDELHLKRLNPLPINVVSDWTKQIANGMSYLHERNIVHRDLKSENILLTKSYPSNAYDEITLKIADFDEMREHTGTATMTLIGTYRWMATEVLLHNRFSKSSDVWSYGVVVWELLTGDLPHKNLTQYDLIKMAEAGKLALSIPESIPETLSQLLKYCFRLENNNRPSFCDIKELFKSSTTTPEYMSSDDTSFSYDDVPPVMLHTIRANNPQNTDFLVTGVALLNKELFLAFEGQAELKVFKAINLYFLRSFYVDGLETVIDMVSSSGQICVLCVRKLFIIDGNGQCFDEWYVDEGAVSLSVTPQSNILCTWRFGVLREYMENGSEYHKVQLPPGFLPFHAVKLSSGHFMVSFENNQHHSVGIFDTDGSIVKSFVENLKFPIYLVVKQGRKLIFVADQKNSRVLQLSPDLSSAKEFLSAKQGLVCPSRICLDDANNRVFVADRGNQNHGVLVFDLPIHK